jgi:hypothetical protein
MSGMALWWINAASGEDLEEVYEAIPPPVAVTKGLDVLFGVSLNGSSWDGPNADAMLETSDSTVGDVINDKQIEVLSLNGRDYLQLANLSSGTVSATQGVESGGQPGAQVAFLLDGRDNNN